jgi:hypothetical protein
MLSYAEFNLTAWRYRFVISAVGPFGPWCGGGSFFLSRNVGVPFRMVVFVCFRGLGCLQGFLLSEKLMPHQIYMFWMLF